MAHHKYTVIVRDNFHYMDEDAEYELGPFATYDAALAVCRKIVDGFLHAQSKDDVIADDLFKSYAMFGEAPSIVCDGEQCDFSAWDYAKQRCKTLSKGRNETL